MRQTTLDFGDRMRLSQQCQKLLDILRIGPATNEQLARVSLKYTSRISDLRKAGHNITCTRLGGGLTQYRLEK